MNEQLKKKEMLNSHVVGEEEKCKNRASGKHIQSNKELIETNFSKGTWPKLLKMIDRFYFKLKKVPESQ